MYVVTNPFWGRHRGVLRQTVTNLWALRQFLIWVIPASLQFGNEVPSPKKLGCDDSTKIHLVWIIHYLEESEVNPHSDCSHDSEVYRK